MQMRARTWMSRALPIVLLFAGATLQAQVPSRIGGVQRARDACDAVASRYGYRVMRRDQENVNAGTYQLPMHVQHGTTEADVTCNYDANRGVATLPPWDDGAGRVAGSDR